MCFFFFVVFLIVIIWWIRENNCFWFYNFFEKIGKRWVLFLVFFIMFYVEKIGNNDFFCCFFNGLEKMGKWEVMFLVLYNVIEKVGKNYVCFFDVFEKMGKSDVLFLCGFYVFLWGWVRERYFIWFYNVLEEMGGIVVI